MLFTIWAPSRAKVWDEKNQVSAIAVFLHEVRHVEDLIAQTVIFLWGYLTPQIYSFAFLAFFIVMEGLTNILPPWLWPWNMIVGFLIPLLPWPSPYRVDAERVAYAVSTWIRIRRYSNFEDANLRVVAVDSLRKAFGGWLYYKMIWRKKTAERVAAEVFDQAIAWCRAERDNKALSPAPFRSKRFTNVVMQLLEKPFRAKW